MDNGTTKRSACSKGSMCCGNCHGGDYPVVAAARLVRPGDYIPRGGIMEASFMDDVGELFQIDFIALAYFVNSTVD